MIKIRLYCGEIGDCDLKEYKLFYKLRNKENRTQSEELLLKYHKILSAISEILVDESKMHMNSETAIDKIRIIISENI